MRVTSYRPSTILNDTISDTGSISLGESVALQDALLGVSKAVAKQLASAWMDSRKTLAPGKDLTGRLVTSPSDKFVDRKLERKLADIADVIVERLEQPIMVEFRDIKENDRVAAAVAAAAAISSVPLTDRVLLDNDFNADRLAQYVTENVDPQDTDTLDSDAKRLYMIVLRESCAGICQAVERLPEFNATANVEMLSRLTELAVDIEVLVANLPSPALRLTEERINDQEFEARYRSYLSSTLENLEIFGVETKGFRPRTPLAVSYMSLRVLAETTDESNFPRDRPVDSGEPIRVEHALVSNRRLLLRGDAGSGKTTLLQWLAVNCARRSFSGPLSSWNSFLPFTIRLRDYPTGSLPRPETYLKASAPTLHGLLPEGWVHRTLAKAPVLLIDGIDELDPSLRERVRKWIEDLLSTHQTARVIVTSRPGAADADWLADVGFTSFYVEAMSHGEIEEFCRRWHLAVRDTARAGSLRLPCDVQELETYRRNLVREIAANAHLKNLASSPLMCAMLCALHLEKRQNLPRERNALYDAALLLLLEGRDFHRGLSDRISMPTRQKIAVLQHVALRATLGGIVQWTRDRFVAQVQSALKRMPDLHLPAEEVADYLIERSGVLREPQIGIIDFVHRSFQEYLAAREVVDSEEAGLLTNNAHLDTWYDTVVMAAGHAPAAWATRLIEQLLARVENEPDVDRELVLLAASCKTTVVTLPPDLAQAVDRAASRLIPPSTISEAQRLANVGDHVVSLLPRDVRALTPEEASACIATASYAGTDDSLGYLREVAADSRYEPQRQISEAWKYFDTNTFKEQVLKTSPLWDGRFWLSRLEEIPALLELPSLVETHVQLGEQEPLKSLSQINPLLSPVTVDAFITDEFKFAEECARLRNIQRLHLRGGTVVDGLPRLADFYRLRSVGLNVDRSSAQVDFFASLQDLTDLSLTGLRAASGVRALVSLAKLQTIELIDSNAAVANLVLANLPQVSAIVLRHTQGVLATASIRQQLSRARRIVVEETKLDDESLEFDRNAQVETLILKHLAVSSGFLRRLPLLVDLSLEGCRGTFDSAHVLETSSLRSIDLQNFSGTISLAALQYRIEPLKIDLRGSTAPTGADEVSEAVRLVGVRG